MNILTFDIEEWFHILDNQSTKTEKEWNNYECRLHQNMDRIFTLLEDNNQKATFFCLGWVARNYPEIIQKIHALGHEVACHSDRHQLAYEQSPAEFKRDLETALDALEDITGEKVRSYRAPGFSFTSRNKWVFEKLIECGIERDCSIFPASRAHGGFADFGKEIPTLVRFKGAEIREFPINTYKILGKNIIFSGGGYFRLLPYFMVRYFTNHSRYVMTYFHPRDLDGDQPLIEDLSLIRKFKSYYGLKQCEKKLDRFLKEFDFLTLDQADRQIDWSIAPVIEM
tara:strand:+ start:23003 stop:23851 length:849 start_codon:yes stop_codon:yes gene_type:complete